VIGQSTTILVSGIFFVILAYYRNALMVSFFVGAIANGILSKLLKKLIAQTRPINDATVATTTTTTNTRNTDRKQSIRQNNSKNIPSDHGMPSSHAMSLGFIATFIACHVTRKVQIPLLLYTVISLYYRVQVQLHTYQQVMVGSVVGSTNGYIWYRLCIGHNPFNIHIMNLVTTYWLNVNGQLPIPYMIIPFLVGATTIGSFERRIRGLFKSQYKQV
jgi:membrane-associated phospholipid phosphatase